MATEVELRFRVAPTVVQRLLGDFPFAAGRLGPGEARLQTSTYFDRADHGLGKRGCAVRIREDGETRVLTLKVGDVQSWLGARREWTVPQSGATPILGRLAKHLPADTGKGPLVPVFRTRVERTIRTIAIDPDVLIELVIDQGTIVARRRRSLVRELELELKRGSARDLCAAALALHRAAGPFVLQPSTKSARGYALATGAHERPCWAEPIALDPGLTTEAACKAILRSCLAQVLANQEPSRHGADSEGVHQLRVGIRRFRTALSCLRRFLPAERHQAIGVEFRWLGQEFGPARDWDVFIDERLAPFLAAGPDAALAGRLTQAADGFRARAYRRVRRALASPRCTEAVLATMLWLEDPWDRGEGRRQRERLGRPFVDDAWRVLRNADRRVRRQHKVIGAGGDEALHAVRIAAKRARYATEFLASLVPTTACESYVKALKQVQDAFGARNDAAQASELLRRVLDAAGHEANGAVAVAIVHPDGPRRAQRRLVESWRRFESTMPLHRVLGHGP